jgi:tetratricopeptide (TPR) repeat protein
MSALFGADHVFMDLEDISPGKNFVHTIDETLAGCDAALVVIGPRWRAILLARLQEGKTDYVRHEIEAAIARKITVVPVLVGGATPDQLNGLPGPLESLPMYQAVELRDSSFKADCVRLAQSLGAPPDRAKTTLHRWFGAGGAIAALIGLVFLVSYLTGVGPWSDSRAQRAMIQQLVATARVQMERTEYESAFKTYDDALKVDAGNTEVMDLQADAAMRWLQNYHVLAGDGQKAEDIAGPELARIQGVLDAALARTDRRGRKAADLLAHMGWTHWLNQRLAFKEFGTAAERDLREALRADGSNVFAHAMLGNWLLQTHGDVAEALRHFESAVKTGNEREFVRRLQLGGLLSSDGPKVRSALLRVANEMRREGARMDDRSKRRVAAELHPGLVSYEELRESLVAVSPKDAWDTYVWVESDGVRREFVRGALLEIEGKRDEALAVFRELGRGLGPGRLADNVAAAVRRLSVPGR